MIAAKGLCCDFFIRSGQKVIDFKVACGPLIGDAISRCPLIGDAINRRSLIGYALNPVFAYQCECVFVCVCV